MRDRAAPFAARPAALLPVAIGAEQAIAHPGWHHARAAALAACRSGPGLVVILGEAGTGKSLLVQDLAWTLRGMGVSVLVPPAGDMALRHEGATGHQVVLIDDASADDSAALERLHALPQVVVLAVRTPTAAASPAFGTQRIIRLQPLPAEETGRFIAARLAQSGLSPAAISGPATEHLAALSGGVPQRLNVLTRQAMLVAHAQRAPSIETGHVLEAASLGGQAVALAAGPVMPAWYAAPVVTAAQPLGLPGLAAPRQRPGTRTCLGVAACLVVIAGWLLIGPDRGIAVKDQPAAAQEAAGRAAVPEARDTGAALLQTPEPTPPAAPETAPRPFEAETAINEAPQAATVEAPQAATGVAVPDSATASTLPFGVARVELRYRAGSAAEGRRAASLAALLRDRGYLVTETAMRGPAGLAGVRYYFAEDRAAAAAIAQVAGLPGGRLQNDRANTEAPPQPGMVSLIVAPTGEPAARPIVAPSAGS